MAAFILAILRSYDSSVCVDDTKDLEGSWRPLVTIQCWKVKETGFLCLRKMAMVAAVRVDKLINKMSIIYKHSWVPPETRWQKEINLGPLCILSAPGEGTILHSGRGKSFRFSWHSHNNPLSVCWGLSLTWYLIQWNWQGTLTVTVCLTDA